MTAIAAPIAPTSRHGRTNYTPSHVMAAQAAIHGRRQNGLSVRQGRLRPQSAFSTIAEFAPLFVASASHLTWDIIAYIKKDKIEG